MRGFYVGLFIIAICFAAGPVRSEIVIVGGPGGIILHELDQVGSSIADYRANAAVRAGRIQALQQRLNECATCSDRTKIESELNY